MFLTVGIFGPYILTVAEEKKTSIHLSFLTETAKAEYKIYIYDDINV